MAVEYQCRCNRCGSVWCVTENDIKQSKRMKTGASLNMLNAAINASDRRTVSSIYGTATASAYANGVVDYSRCPNCRSIKINVTTRVI